MTGHVPPHNPSLLAAQQFQNLGRNSGSRAMETAMNVLSVALLGTMLLDRFKSKGGDEVKEAIREHERKYHAHGNHR